MKIENRASLEVLRFEQNRHTFSRWKDMVDTTFGTEQPFIFPISKGDAIQVNETHHFPTASGQLTTFELNSNLELVEVTKVFEDYPLLVPLDPFSYKKPIPNSEVKTGFNELDPDEVWEDKKREGYYPLMIVKDALRPPNHWHRIDDALVCAIQTDRGWETRYFPKNNIHQETWEQAEAILSAPQVVRGSLNYDEEVNDGGKKQTNEFYPEGTYYAAGKETLKKPASIIIHTMYVPAKENGGEESFDPQKCKDLLENTGQGLSSHVLIPRSGMDYQGRYIIHEMATSDRIAWHAGNSRLPKDPPKKEFTSLNSSALGVELIASETSGITDSQYNALVGVVIEYLATYKSIEHILGHNEIAGDHVRGKDQGKTDPWGFDWDKFLGMLAKAMGKTQEEVKSRFRSQLTSD